MILPLLTCAPLTCHVVQHEPYHDEGFDDFRDFVNFIDGVGLSAQWTPEYDLDWLRIVDHNHEPHRQSREPEDQPVSEGEDIGSPFGTWLPSAPADNEVVNPRDGAFFLVIYDGACGLTFLFD